MSNVTLWFAKDQTGKIVTIDKITKDNKNEKYICPMCGSELQPKLGDIKNHHFAHIDKSKCTNESMIHFWVKNELLKVGESFTVNIDNNKIKQFICKDIILEKEYNTSNGIYKPDITIVTEDDTTIFIEINHTSKKKLDKYINQWLELNNIVIEVSTKEVLNNYKNNIREFNAINYKKKNIENSILKSAKSVCKKNNENYLDYVDTLQWITNDCYKYENDKIELKELFYEIYLLDNNEIIMEILRKSSACINVFNDLNNYGYEYFEELIEPYKKEYNNVIINYNVWFYHIEDCDFNNITVYNKNIHKIIYFQSNITKFRKRYFTNVFIFLNDYKQIMNEAYDFANQIQLCENFKQSNDFKILLNKMNNYVKNTNIYLNIESHGSFGIYKRFNRYNYNYSMKIKYNSIFNDFKGYDLELDFEVDANNLNMELFFKSFISQIENILNNKSILEDKIYYHSKYGVIKNKYNIILPFYKKQEEIIQFLLYNINNRFSKIYFKSFFNMEVTFRSHSFLVVEFDDDIPLELHITRDNVYLIKEIYDKSKRSIICNNIFGCINEYNIKTLEKKLIKIISGEIRECIGR